MHVTTEKCFETFYDNNGFFTTFLGCWFVYPKFGSWSAKK